ncbi:SDR family oxidoreductase [Saccharothrix obliqua]|uniref:SDR family oxidoreductase n=1 Tax=Saccharothrix obliqua TaxID=2861747 RepID=UPI001C604B2A|nr:SDR family NAD(P)-dependent oxidoreductase [Saccharothrix obliqua]MBW4721443.1 SDR family NAD(P)-dependent oxidoreductase [Saccharothrix obliqua]
MNGVALVTGASSGIGDAVARELAAAGATVAVTARRADRLAALAEEIGGHAYPADLTDPDRDVVADVVGDHGRLDVVVANAGVLLLGGVEHAPAAELRRMVEVNLLGAVRVAHSALPHLLAAAAGPRGVADLVVIGSAGRRLELPFTAGYDATKAGLAAFCASLRKEVARRYVRVALVEPGFVAPTELPLHTRPEVMAGLAGGFDPGAPLSPADVGGLVRYVVEQPRHAAVERVVLRPTEQVE